ncbi:hypothetical protein V0288_22420 [Pannus brasiliensis CCIBt3594]|uniref:DUF6788 domain-containing protein n=1 Tax=Pannus brasiliensis CCIBt3594 TaxID=1427578 RepID=A0AAW9R1H9_9CHRO
MLSVKDKVVYQGRRAVVDSIPARGKKAKIIFPDFQILTVPIADLEPWIEPLPDQLPLLDVSQFSREDEGRSGFTDWEVDTDGDDQTDRNLSVSTGDRPDGLGTIDDKNSVPNPTSAPDRPDELGTIDDTNSVPNLPSAPDRPDELGTIDDKNSVPNPTIEKILDSLPPGCLEIKTVKGQRYRYWRYYEGGKKRSKYLGKVGA